jgi:hypothetical protein
LFLVGFFDPEGYYFNAEGFDEFGGYYDDDLHYVDAYMEDNEEELGQETYGNEGEEAELTLELLENAPAGTQFVAVLRNLPYFSKNEEIERELKQAYHITYDKLDVNRAEGKVKAVRVTLKDKTVAKQLYELYGKPFLGRNLKVAFPDLGLDAIAPTSTPTQVPATHAPEKQEAKKQEAAKPVAEKPATKPAETKKAEPVPEEKKETKPKEETKPIEVPANTKSVWDLSADDAIKIIESTNKKTVTIEASKPKVASSTTKPAPKKTAAPAAKAKRGNNKAK